MLPLLFPGIYCNLETGHDRKDFQNPGVSGRWTLILLLGAPGIAAGAASETAIVIDIQGFGRGTAARRARGRARGGGNYLDVFVRVMGFGAYEGRFLGYRDFTATESANRGGPPTGSADGSSGGDVDIMMS